MSNLTTAQKLLLLLVVWFLLNGSIGGGSPAPFKTATAACLIVEETAVRQSLTAEQQDVLTSIAPGSVRDYCDKHGIDFRLLDKDNRVDMDADWVKEAWKTERKSLPWIVTANAKTGGSQPVTTTADGLKLLTPIGSK